MSRLCFKEIICPSVNEFIDKFVPEQSKEQLKCCLRCIMTIIADHYGPIYIFKCCKLDIKDCFWRLGVAAEDAWKFFMWYQRLMIKKVYRWYWASGPWGSSNVFVWITSIFCINSESVCDTIQKLSITRTTLPLHNFKSRMKLKKDVP